MRTYDDPDSEDYNPEAVAADRALGRVAADLVRDRNFPEFTEMVCTGAGCYEPHLIYRKGDSFLIVETEVIDENEEEMGAWGREVADGKVAERGSREYLVAGLRDLAERIREESDVGAAAQAALTANRIKYLYVTLVVSGPPGKQEVKSIDMQEFKL